MTKRRARILIAARDKYPPFRVDIVDLFSRHLNRDFDLAWVMRSDQPVPGGEAGNDRERFYVIAPGDGKRGGKLRAALRQVTCHARMLFQAARGRYDIVQCRDMFLAAPFYLVAARIGGARFCYWMSFPMEEGYIHQGRTRMAQGGRIGGRLRVLLGQVGRFALYGIALPDADAVFVQSDRMKHDVCAQGIDPARVHPVPMGVNTEQYSGGIEPLPDDVYGTAKVILYVGTLDAARRMDVPARGAAAVLQRRQDAIFVQIGTSSPAERQAIIDAAQQLGVADRLQFREQMPLAELFRHISRADVRLAPYPVDPPMLASATPTKLIEYAFLGARVVANRHPDQETVIGCTQCGVLTDFEAEDFAAGIERALDLGRLDDAAARRAADWVAGNRSYGVLAGQVKSVYDRLLENS